MARLTDDQQALLDDPVYAWVTVHRPDGTLHSTVVWVDTDGGDVRFNTALGRAKERYLKDDPRISVSALDPDNPWRFVSVAGTASFEAEGADAHIDALAKKYLDADSYPFRKEGEERVTVRVSADQVIWNTPG